MFIVGHGASLYFLFVLSHSNYSRMRKFMFSVCNLTFQICAGFCFMFAISHSKYRHMCNFIFSVCNITFQIMSYVQIHVFCLQYHIPRYSHMCRFMFSVCNITLQIMSYVQVYVFCLQYHIPTIVVCANSCFLFAISHSKI